MITLRAFDIFFYVVDVLMSNETVSDMHVLLLIAMAIEVSVTVIAFERRFFFYPYVVDFHVPFRVATLHKRFIAMIARERFDVQMREHMTPKIATRSEIAVAIGAMKWTRTGMFVHVHFESVLLSEASTTFVALERWFLEICLLYTSPSPRDLSTSRMPSSA